jgi:hypothetical protein
MNENESKQVLKQSLTKLAKIKKNSTEKEFARILFKSTTSSSPTIDKFSTWLLAGTGATAALMISNLTSLSSVLNSPSIKYSLYILAISSLLGFFAKYYSLRCQITDTTADSITDNLKHAFERHEDSNKSIKETANKHNITIDTDPDLEKPLREYIDAYPRLVKKYLEKKANDGMTDPLASYKLAAKCLYKQIVLTTSQFLLFLFFIVFIANSVKY